MRAIIALGDILVGRQAGNITMEKKTMKSKCGLKFRDAIM